MKRSKERRIKKLRKQNIKEKGKLIVENWNEVQQNCVLTFYHTLVFINQFI
jgi:hypothetical protein